MSRLRRYLVLRDTGSDEDEEDDEEVVHTHTHHHYHHPHDGAGSHASAHHPIVAAVHERLESPPATWGAYAGRPDAGVAIVEMEFQELVAARHSGSDHQVKKELTDLAAACIRALKEM